MITFVISNRKGGVGKTTTAFNLAAGLQKKDRAVLAIDLDGQCNLTRMAGLQPKQSSSFGIITGEIAPVETIVRIDDLFDIIPASPLLTSADRVLPQGFNRNLQIRKAVEDLNPLYDICIIDTPPSMGVVTINALAAADFVIIPAEANELSMDGILAVYDSVMDVKQNVTPTLEISGILLTRYKARTSLAKQYRKMIEETAKQMHTLIYRQPIRESVVFAELPSVHKSIFDYKPKSAAAKDYEYLVDEVIGMADTKETFLDIRFRQIKEKNGGILPPNFDWKKLDYD